MTEPLPTGAVIGILGGGQLGRMLAVAAARLGLRCHVFDPDPDAPAGDVVAMRTVAPYADRDALVKFGQSVDVITYEFENIPTQALDILQDYAPIQPGRRALATSQDRLVENQFLADLGLPTAPFAAVDTVQDLVAALGAVGSPAILKTRRFGYDGKGQARITDPGEAAAAFDAIGQNPAILEGFIDFTTEISVIAARGLDGAVACYDPGENVHRDGILRTTTVPAGVPPSVATDAILLAGRILNALDYVGVLGVELFVTRYGLVVNEIAPRVHNSGHWTQDAASICQFEQHIRAIAGWPLGDGSRHSAVVMENLIGSDMDRVPELAQQNVALHLYGKSAVKPGRKMGHVNRIMPAQA